MRFQLGHRLKRKLFSRKYISQAMVPRVLLVGILLIGVLVGTPEKSYPQIQGVCSNCHTMHNSQDGAPMNLDNSATPNEGLLRLTCLGCHAQIAATATVMMGPNIVPQVMHAGEDHLAGGNFGYITGLAGSGEADNKGHNIAALTGTDDTLYGPPGFFHSDHWVNTETLSCASFRAGCHGVRRATQSIVPIIGIAGSHHKNESGQLTDAEWPYQSYRFLHKVKGLESSDWEENATADNHNEYSAASSPLQLDCATRCHTTAGMVISRSGTISGFCATCHSEFHTLSYDGVDGIGSTISSPFLRHPTDISLPATGEYADYTQYNLDAPVGRLIVPAASSSTVTPGSDAVTCLSCHMAHASDYPDMLRWDYTTTIAGEAGDAADTGCFVCHSTKE